VAHGVDDGRDVLSLSPCGRTRVDAQPMGRRVRCTASMAFGRGRSLYSYMYNYMYRCMYKRVHLYIARPLKHGVFGSTQDEHPNGTRGARNGHSMGMIGAVRAPEGHLGGSFAPLERLAGTCTTQCYRAMDR
jgi:hypothetical protein